MGFQDDKKDGLSNSNPWMLFSFMDFYP